MCETLLEAIGDGQDTFLGLMSRLTDEQWNFRAFVETVDREIKNRVFENPFPQIGTLSGYDWMTLAALHVIPHSMRIEDVKSEP